MNDKQTPITNFITCAATAKRKNQCKCIVFFVASWICMFLPLFYTNNLYLPKIIRQPDKMPHNRDCDHWIPWDTDSKKTFEEKQM